MNTKITLTAVVPENLSNLRLDAAMAQLFPDYSRAQIQQWIREGAVNLNGQPVKKTRTAVKPTQQIDLNATLIDQGDWQAQNIPLDIVYEDDSLIVINKPVGLVVHPGAGNPDKTLVNALLYYAPELSEIPRAGIIHRLDKETSGLLVIARTLPAHHALTKMMQEREISREYRALVLGNIISGNTIDTRIGRHPVQRIKMAVTGNGRTAITHYRVIERFEKHTLLKVKLETGRTHQIRVHMAHIGHPIVGDPVYGKRGVENKSYTLSHQALHAYKLGLKHPISGQNHYWKAPMPEDMLDLIEKLQARELDDKDIH